MNYLSYNNLEIYKQNFSKYLYEEPSKKQCFDNIESEATIYDKTKVNALIPMTVNDFRFLPILMRQLDAICGKVIFIYSEYLFNQKVQDKEKLNKIFKLPKKLGLKSQFVFVKYEIDFSVNEFFADEYRTSPKRYWINKARYQGLDHVDANAKWVLLIDSDEIPDANNFIKWADTIDWNEMDNKYTLNFDNYVYFWKNCYIKKENENSIVLLSEKVFRKKEEYKPLFMNEFERTVFYKYIPEKYCVMNIKYNDECLFHHYSWVRNLDEMKSKVLNWGHSDDHLFIEIEYDDPTTYKNEKDRKVMVNYMYANYFAYKFIYEYPQFEEYQKQTMEMLIPFAKLIDKYNHMKSISKLYPEKFNCYMEGVLKWFDNPTIQNNFMGYKCVYIYPKFYVDYLYEDFNE